MYKVLLIDDDVEFGSVLSEFLRESDFEVDYITDAVQALSQVKLKEYDLLLIDLYLEKFTGTQLVELIKVDYKKPNIIIMTNSSDDIDEIKALQLGVSEYLRKNISINVMLQRIKNVLKKDETTIKDELLRQSISENITLDIINRLVTKDGEEIHLTYLEFDLLDCFLKNRNKLLTRDYILESVWKIDNQQNVIDSRTVDVHVKNIRRKLDITSIHSMRGLGYRWHEK